jgi:hypothetical protein
MANDVHASIVIKSGMIIISQKGFNPHTTIYETDDPEELGRRLARALEAYPGSTVDDQRTK